MANFMPRYHC
uniref:Uncharacterized protein n=1 Tax=Moniliophthora roreri TaxID=221103 RepID=A0A0W0FYC2_MONRR